MPKASKSPVTGPAANFQFDEPITPAQSSTSSAPPRQPGSRASHACDRCRVMRSKCSGGTRCSKCVKDDAVCVYSDRKREQNKKSLDKSVDRIKQLVEEKAALVDAMTDIVCTPGVSPEQYRTTMDLLSQMSSDAPEESASVSTASRSRRDSSSGLASSRENEAVLSGGEMAVMADVGSSGHHGGLQHVVHLNHGSGMTGHFGKMSEMSWMQRAREYLVGAHGTQALELTPPHIDFRSAQAFDLTYFMDDENLLSINEDLIVPEQLPPTKVALVLSEAYFHAAQGVFRFVRRRWFLHELDELLTRTERLSWAQRRTLGLINIIWAVGAKWLQITQLNGQVLGDTHLTYYARARALGLDHRILFDHPDVEMTQAIGVLGFYLLINGSIQRSWSVIGQALRHATALGLHLRFLVGAIGESEGENRARLWYSLFQVETLLSEMTGRSKCVRTVEVTLSPSSIESTQETRETPNEEVADEVSHTHSRSAWQSFLGMHRGVALNLSGGNVEWDRFVPVGLSFSASYFRVRIMLCMISDEIATQLYSGATKMTWFEYQTLTRALDEKLRNWHDLLPEELRVHYRGQSHFDPRSRLDLAMYYESVRMMLLQPFLGEIEIVDESLTSVDFNKTCARGCVEAALNMLNAIPDKPVATEVFQILPWWSILHYLCQAGAVLLLELCLGMQHMQGESKVVLSAVRKDLNYLWVFSSTSKSAYKAWSVLRPSFDRALAPYRSDTLSDIPEEAPEPPNLDDDDRRTVERVTWMLHRSR